jgi:hypothetical protein
LKDIYHDLSSGRIPFEAMLILEMEYSREEKFCGK